jgi:hypothetical protein
MMTTGQVIRWWELRRLFYNAVLFIIGVSSIVGMEWLMTKVIPLGADAIEPMVLVLGIAVYGLMANLCYTLGWVIELRVRKNNSGAARAFGRRMFRGGLAFSCILTTLPFWLACLYWATHKANSN